MTVVTNNVPRPVLDSWDLTDKERKEFDYLEENHQFFRYKGEVYDLDDFTPPYDASFWDGYAADSFFSGILIKFTDDFESLIVGRYYE